MLLKSGGTSHRPGTRDARRRRGLRLGGGRRRCARRRRIRDIARRLQCAVAASAQKTFHVHGSGIPRIGTFQCVDHPCAAARRDRHHPRRGKHELGTSMRVTRDDRVVGIVLGHRGHDTGILPLAGMLGRQAHPARALDFTSHVRRRAALARVHRVARSSHRGPPPRRGPASQAADGAERPVA